MKEKLNPLVEEYRRIVNQNSFRVLSILVPTSYFSGNLEEEKVPKLR